MKGSNLPDGPFQGKPDTRPEMIIISQNLLGGGTSFNRNMLAHFPEDPFDIHSIYLDPIEWNGARVPDLTLRPGDEVFPYGNETRRSIAKRLSKHISDREGVVVSNLKEELICLDLFRKPAKTIYFICHDDGFIDLALKYQSIIDVYITHNIAVHEALKILIPGRDGDFHFIQHGVRIPDFNKKENLYGKLRVVFLARHYAFKGLFDLPEIDKVLKAKGCSVEWMILGDGPDRESFKTIVSGLANFNFAIPQNAEEVLAILKMQDVFILPSRKDGLPVALLESMSVGCVPVIANFSEGIKKVVTDDIGFVLPIGDNTAFANSILKLDKDRGMLFFLSRNCVEKTKREFDITKQALEYFKLYTSYRQFKRKTYLGVADVLRHLTSYSFVDKLRHVVFRIKSKINPGKEIAS